MNIPFAVPLWLLAMASLLQSCIVSQYRVIETQWQHAEVDYMDDSSDVSELRPLYWCWGEQGRLRVGLNNTSDSTIYIDLYASYLAGDERVLQYSSDTVEFPVYYALVDAFNPYDWPSTALLNETCDRYLAVQSGQGVVFSKFSMHSVVADSLNRLDFYGESALYGPLNSPAKGAHHMEIRIGREGRDVVQDDFFYVGARRKWIYKSPYKVYTPDHRQYNYFLRSKTFHPVGTFLMLALVSFSIHLGTGS